MGGGGSPLSVENTGGGFPGASVVEDPPVKAGDTDLIPGPGRPHMPQNNQACVPQPPSLCSGAWEPQLLNPECPRALLRNKRIATNEKPAHHNEE